MSKQHNSVSRRYAKALWSSVKNGSAEQFLKNLQDISALLDADQNLKTLAKSPVFSLEEKKKVFAEIFNKLEFSAGIVSFLNLLLEKDRFVLLDEISVEFRDLYLLSNKTKEAFIESAFVLSEQQQEAVKNVLEAALDTKVEIETKVNPALIAGIRVYVDGRSIDATLNSNLEFLKAELLGAEA